MITQRLGSTVVAIAALSMSPGCRTEQRTEARTAVKTANAKEAIHYLEIVTSDVDALAAMYEKMHGLSFGPPDPDLGQARVATRPDGGLVGIRKPLAAHEQPPLIRAYFAVDDIRQAVKRAEESGAILAYPPTRQGKRGTLAIVIQGDVQHGLWQRDP